MTSSDERAGLAAPTSGVLASFFRLLLDCCHKELSLYQPASQSKKTHERVVVVVVVVAWLPKKVSRRPVR